MNPPRSIWLRKEEIKISKKVWALGCVAALLLAEGAIQISGVLDYPLYEANNEIGYIPAPNQAGAFLRTNEWVFNEHSMGTGPFTPNPSRFNVLLVGDSLVMGGNRMAQAERIGPQLEKRSGWQVWPIGASSWAMQNELTYIRQHPQILEQVDAVVFLSNSEDFDEPSSWAYEVMHPRSHPVSGLAYMTKKYLIKEDRPPVTPELQVPKRDWLAELTAFAQEFDKPVFLFAYPTVEELNDKQLMADQLDAVMTDIEDRVGADITVFKVADSEQWKPDFYRDYIHPTSHGNEVLADIFYQNLCSQASLKMKCAPPAEVR